MPGRAIGGHHQRLAGRFGHLGVDESESDIGDRDPMRPKAERHAEQVVAESSFGGRIRRRPGIEQSVRHARETDEVACPPFEPRWQQDLERVYHGRHVVVLRGGSRELLHAGEDAVQARVRLGLRDAVEAADEPVVTELLSRGGRRRY